MDKPRNEVLFWSCAGLAALWPHRESIEIRAVVKSSLERQAKAAPGPPHSKELPHLLLKNPLVNTPNLLHSLEQGFVQLRRRKKAELDGDISRCRMIGRRQPGRPSDNQAHVMVH